jgi:hypothetical protein
VFRPRADVGDPSRELPWKYREPHVREIRLLYHANSSLLLVVPGCLCNRNTLVSDPAPGNMTWGRARFQDFRLPLRPDSNRVNAA